MTMGGRCRGFGRRGFLGRCFRAIRRGCIRSGFRPSALKTPIALKPGREEPWTPLRVIEALAAAGIPREAFGFYPTDHGGAATLLQSVDRAMLFGDASTTRTYRNDPRVELHGPGYSKVILGR